MSATAEAVRPLPSNPEELVSEQFVADYYGVKPRTIRLWRYQGTGPAYVRVQSNVVRYRWGAIVEHNAAKSAIHTAQETLRVS